MQLFSKQELELLFPNQIQREIFEKGMSLLVNVIVERTVNVPFVQLECVNKE